MVHVKDIPELVTRVDSVRAYFTACGGGSNIPGVTAVVLAIYKQFEDLLPPQPAAAATAAAVRSSQGQIWRKP